MLFKKTKAKSPTLIKRLNKYQLLKNMLLRLAIMTGTKIAKRIRSIKGDQRHKLPLSNKIQKALKNL